MATRYPRFLEDASKLSDDEIYEADGTTVRSGKAVRVPMTLRDASSLVVDAKGGTSMGSRPGFRTIIEDGSGSALDAAAAVHRRRVLDDVSRARAEYHDYITNAWRGEDAFGDDEDYGPQALGQVCSVAAEEYPAQYGAPGHVRRVGGRYLCVPDQSRDSATDSRERAYQLYDKHKAVEYKDPDNNGDDDDVDAVVEQTQSRPNKPNRSAPASDRRTVDVAAQQQAHTVRMSKIYAAEDVRLRDAYKEG